MSAKASTIAKAIGGILAYSVWFGFTLFLSFWFFLLVTWIENRVGVFSGMRFTVMLISWAGFVCVAGWLPIWLTKKWRPDANQTMMGSAAFLLSLLICTVVCTIAWGDFVDGKLYGCTDSVPFNFLSPGNWVHGNYETVPKIVPRSMSEPDMIKEGWSVPKLWCLWWTWVAASVGVSALLSFVVWWPKTRNTATIPPPKSLDAGNG